LKFIVEGSIDLGKENRRFAKEVEAPNENAARELALNKLGGAHGRKRSRIQVSAVRKVQA